MNKPHHVPILILIIIVNILLFIAGGMLMGAALSHYTFPIHSAWIYIGGVALLINSIYCIVIHILLLIDI
jgi:hypothetical protein